VGQDASGCEIMGWTEIKFDKETGEPQEGVAHRRY
jgi:hypothetical protein